MKYIMIVAVFSMVTSLAYSQAIDKSIQVSKEILEHIQLRKSDQVIPFFDETMKKSITASRLDGIWVSLDKQLGGFLSIGEITTENVQGYKVVYILCIFKNDKLKFKVVYNTENKISGLFFVPANQK